MFWSLANCRLHLYLSSQTTMTMISLKNYLDWQVLHVTICDHMLLQLKLNFTLACFRFGCFKQFQWNFALVDSRYFGAYKEHFRISYITGERATFAWFCRAHKSRDLRDLDRGHKDTPGDTFWMTWIYFLGDIDPFRVTFKFLLGLESMVLLWNKKSILLNQFEVPT